jgi:ABC-type uncharacterized transport system auxiliary subunit
MSVRRAKILFAWMGSVIIAGGCAAARPIKYYELTVPAGTAQTSDANTLPVTLLVAPIQGSHLYREDPIVYSGNGEAMGTYENQRWSQPPVEMLQELVGRELRASGHYRAVNSLRSNGGGDYVLRGRLYDFKEVEGSGGLVARVVAEFELHEAKTGSTVWSKYYAHDEPVSGKDVPSVVAALDRNTQNIVGQVKSSLDQYFAAHPASTPAPSAQ